MTSKLSRFNDLINRTNRSNWLSLGSGLAADSYVLLPGPFGCPPSDIPSAPETCRACDPDHVARVPGDRADLLPVPVSHPSRGGVIIEPDT